MADQTYVSHQLDYCCEGNGEKEQGKGGNVMLHLKVVEML